MLFIQQIITIALKTTATIVGILAGILIASAIIYWAGVFFVFIQQRIEEWTQ